MGNKIKKDEPAQLQDLPKLKIKYTYAVPVMGLADALAMFSFYMNPATDGSMALKLFFLFFAAVGIGFMYWGLKWKITADGKAIVIHPAFGRKKTLPFRGLKKAVIHKRRQTETFSYYELVDQDNQVFAKLYPIMKDSSTLLARIKRLKFPVAEVYDK